jgi:hypothetical protein
MPLLLGNSLSNNLCVPPMLLKNIFCFYDLAVIEATVNICMQVFVQTQVFSSFGSTLGKNPPNCLSECLDHFIFPGAVNESLPHVHISICIVSIHISICIVSILDLGHANSCVVVSVLICIC